MNGCDVWTSHYRSRDPDRLDITRAGCDRLLRENKPAPGVILAPSAKLVFPALRALKAARSEDERTAIWLDYRRAYLEELRRNGWCSMYRARPIRSLFNRPKCRTLRGAAEVIALVALDLAPGGHSVSYPRSEFLTNPRGSRYSGPTTKTPLSAVTGSGANTERVGPVRRLNVEHALPLGEGQGLAVNVL